MARFDVYPGQKIKIKSDTYEFMSHPTVPTMVFGQEGRKATVYQVKAKGKMFALKVFKKLYRNPSLIDTCKTLSQLTSIGLEVCKRQCLSVDYAGSLIEKYPDLEYAILMPWMGGKTWYDIVYEKMVLDETECFQLAATAVEILSRLEEHGFAHCDIAGANVIVNPTAGDVGFIDVEDMFGPGFSLASSFPQGTDGYRHRAVRTIKKGQWCTEGDRFSAAILLAEILCWHMSGVRQQADIESYFANGELHEANSLKYKRILDALAGISKPLSDCFSRAWNSTTLEDCPKLDEWKELIKSVLVRQVPILSPVHNPLGNKSYTVEWTPIAQAKWYELQESKKDTIVKQSSPYVDIINKGANRLNGEPKLSIFRNQAGIYSYRVRAYTKYGYSEYSDPIQVTIQNTLPIHAPRLNPITNLNDEGPESLMISWTRVYTASGYLLYESNSSDFVEEKLLYKGPSIAFVLEQCKPGKYYYRVFSYNTSGNYDYQQPSNVVSIEVTDRSN